jgi:hypothetical protein
MYTKANTEAPKTFRRKESTSCHSKQAHRPPKTGGSGNSRRLQVWPVSLAEIAGHSLDSTKPSHVATATNNAIGALHAQQALLLASNDDHRHTPSGMAVQQTNRPCSSKTTNSITCKASTTKDTASCMCPSNTHTGGSTITYLRTAVVQDRGPVTFNCQGAICTRCSNDLKHPRLTMQHTHGLARPCIRQHGQAMGCGWSCQGHAGAMHSCR